MPKPPPQQIQYLTPVEFALLNHAVVRALPFGQFAPRYPGLMASIAVLGDPNHLRHNLK